MNYVRTRRHRGMPALELIEEATSLLRGAPAEIFARYYLGALPFMLAGLYFWADMSCNADADERLAGFSLALALLFLWMKFWQSRFCGELYRLLMGGAATSSRHRDLALAQTLFQPWAFVVLPLAALITIPFGWCFAFFQNITVLGGDADARHLYARARRQALLWQGQNHILMVIFLLLGLIVFANLCICVFYLPKALQTLLGIESVFSRANRYMFNSTFWAAMAALTHLCIDPLVKAAYLLRCHYGESLESGADLLAELKGVQRAAGAPLVSLLLAACVLFGGTAPLSAAETGTPDTGNRATVQVERLDKAIGQVIQRPEFAWRLPRSDEHQEREIPGFIRSALKLIKKWGKAALESMGDFLKWLADKLPRFKSDRTTPSHGWEFREYVILCMYGVLAVCLCCCGLFLWRRFRGHRPTPVDISAAPIVVEPDVRDENVTADELTGQRWTALAKELLSKGEVRLALRALFLACLACLAEERLIVIARFKSDREYERELKRFAHALPEVISSFAANLDLFERAWYGRLEPGREAVDTFMANNERILAGVRQK